MLPAIVLLTLFTVVSAGITTIPFPIGLLVISMVLLRSHRVFFLALGLGLYADIIGIRPLGYTGLVLIVFTFLLFLYERKFEIQTSVFVFLSTFLGSIIYLAVFGYSGVLLPAIINSILAVLLFKIFGKLNRRKANYEVEL